MPAVVPLITSGVGALINHFANSGSSNPPPAPAPTKTPGTQNAQPTTQAPQVSQQPQGSPVSQNPRDPAYINSQLQKVYQALGQNPTGPGTGPTDIAYFAQQIANTGGWKPNDENYWPQRIAQEMDKAGIQHNANPDYSSLKTNTGPNQVNPGAVGPPSNLSTDPNNPNQVTSSTSYGNASTANQSTSGDPGAYAGYSDFAQTGGFSPQDLANIRARALSPVSAVYANAQREVNRQKAIQGGYSPGFGALEARMARGQAQGLSDAATGAESNIAQMVQQGKLSGLSGMAGTGTTTSFGNQSSSGTSTNVVPPAPPASSSDSGGGFLSGLAKVGQVALPVVMNAFGGQNKQQPLTARQTVPTSGTMPAGLPGFGG